MAGPSHGTQVLNANGSLSYTGGQLPRVGQLHLQGQRGTADSNVATVSLTVTAVNDAPLAVIDSYTTAEDTVVDSGGPWGPGNDTDVDGDALTAAVVAGPSHGTLVLNANGSLSYTPAANYHGSDSFTYKANDGTADSNVATVSLTVTAVNDAAGGQ